MLFTGQGRSVLEETALRKNNRAAHATRMFGSYRHQEFQFLLLDAVHCGTESEHHVLNYSHIFVSFTGILILFGTKFQYSCKRRQDEEGKQFDKAAIRDLVLSFCPTMRSVQQTKETETLDACIRQQLDKKLTTTWAYSSKPTFISKLYILKPFEEKHFNLYVEGSTRYPWANICFSWSPFRFVCLFFVFFSL